MQGDRSFYYKKMVNFKKDFENFLDKQKQLQANADHVNKYGVSTDEVMDAWKQFVQKD